MEKAMQAANDNQAPGADENLIFQMWMAAAAAPHEREQCQAMYPPT